MECDFLTLNTATDGGGRGGDLKLISISTYLLLCGSVGLLRLDQVRSVGVAVGVSVRVAVGVAVSAGVPKALLWGFTSGSIEEPES